MTGSRWGVAIRECVVGGDYAIVSLSKNKEKSEKVQRLKTVDNHCFCFSNKEEG